MSLVNKLGTVTAALTMSILVPAAWGPLGAGGPEGTQTAQPAYRSLKAGDAQVSVSVDRTAVEAGDRVTVELVGVADAERDVTVLVALQEQNGSPMSRVPTPPTTVDSERVTLAAAPGGGEPRQISFVLAGRQVADGADPILTAGAVSQYTILVTPAKDAAEEPGNEVWNDDVGAQGAAMVQVSARRPSAFEVSMEARPRGADEASYAGVVRIRNTSAKTLKGLNCGLSPYPAVQAMGMDFAPTSAEWSLEWSDGTNGQIAELAPGEEAVLHFTAALTGGEKGALYANVWASYGGIGSGSASFGESLAADDGGEPVVGVRFAQPPPGSERLDVAPNAADIPQ